MASTEGMNKLVTLLNEDGFQDGYWCRWLVVEFPDFKFDWDYKRKVLEPIVASVPYSEYDEEGVDEDVAEQLFMGELERVFQDKGFTVKIEPAAFVFVGGE